MRSLSEWQFSFFDSFDPQISGLVYEIVQDFFPERLFEEKATGEEISQQVTLDEIMDKQQAATKLVSSILKDNQHLLPILCHEKFRETMAGCILMGFDE